MRALLPWFLVLMLLSGIPSPAGATPDEIRQFEQRLLDEAKKAGLELGSCRVAVEDEAPTMYLVSAQCSNMRYRCLFAVRKGDGAVQPIGCADNPEYKESERIDNRTKL